MLEYAYDETGSLTYIGKAKSKDHVYKCPECGALLITKNREFERKKDPHYAHKNDEDCIGGLGESIEHRNTKILVYNLLKSLKQYVITTDIPEYPDYIIPYDILQDIDEIVMEKQTIGKFIPDISLKSKGKLLRSVEIVYTHDDDPEKTRKYRLEHIDVLIVITNKDIYSQLKSNEKQPEIKIKKRNSGRILLPELKAVVQGVELDEQKAIANLKALKTNNFIGLLSNAELKYAYEKRAISIETLEKYINIINYSDLSLKQYKTIKQLNINLFYKLKAINWGEGITA